MSVKNETGNKYGRLTVLERAGSKNRAAQWLCECECGNTGIFSGARLRSGHTKSCGCLRGGRNLKNEVGNKYGKLTVLERVGSNKHGVAQWLCKCDCGNTGIFVGTRLRDGQTKSCGCLQRERARESNLIEEVGNKYGKLTVLERAGSNKYHQAQWLCKCDCGSLHITLGSSLRDGKVKSCGCIKSLGEEAIATFLTELDIKFQKEYTFDDLRGIGGGLLRFDFAIFKDEQLTHLIEFDGSQHTDTESGFYSETTVKHDQMKNDYCIKNNIRLIRLTSYENLTAEVLGLQNGGSRNEK